MESKGLKLKDSDQIFLDLAKSEFRSTFRLKGKELKYLRDKGFQMIQEHAYYFINTRLAPAYPTNDGKQTPMRNHPVFIAQHATATCCRRCLEKWHKIERGREMTADEIDYVVSVLMKWLKKEAGNQHSRSS